MLNKKNQEKFTKLQQTSLENVIREYCQHLFLSYLYQNTNSEKLLFKGGTALRFILQSPRFSEDLDFTGLNINKQQIETLLTDTLANIERTGIDIKIIESKSTTGGYLQIISFLAYKIKVNIQIEISLRNKKKLKGTRTLIESDYLPAYTIVHLSIEDIIKEKITALFARQKPRDFYDYFFLLSGNYPLVKDADNLKKADKLLKKSKMNFRTELKKFLPVSQAAHLKDFKKVLEQKISFYLFK